MAEEAESYLRSLLNKNLRVTTTDGRLFWGQFICTDPDANIILTGVYEYTSNQPPKTSAEKNGEDEDEGSGTGDGSDKPPAGFSSRYLGLVVVPGKYITRIQTEDFASQMRSMRLLRY